MNSKQRTTFRQSSDASITPLLGQQSVLISSEPEVGVRNHERQPDIRDHADAIMINGGQE